MTPNEHFNQINKSIELYISTKNHEHLDDAKWLITQIKKPTDGNQ